MKKSKITNLKREYESMMQAFLSDAPNERLQLFKIRYPGYRWEEHEGETFKETIDKEIRSYVYDDNHKRQYTDNIVDLKIQATIRNLKKSMGWEEEYLDWIVGENKDA